MCLFYILMHPQSCAPALKIRPEMIQYLPKTEVQIGDIITVLQQIMYARRGEGLGLGGMGRGKFLILSSLFRAAF
jgi:hypothetical protein